MLSINTNLSAQSASNQIGTTQDKLNSSMEKLTTGSSINRSADDVSGSALSSRFETFANRTDQYIRNAEDGTNMIQTFDGALEQTDDLIQRMKVLGTQAQNGTNTATDRGLIQKEFDQLSDEVTRNANASNYNGITMLDTAGTTADVVVGAGIDNVVSLTSADFTATGLGIDAIDLATGFADADAWKAGVDDLLDAASASVNDKRAEFGSVQNRLEFTVSNLENVSENTSSALSNLQDTDFASETAELAKQKVLAATSQAMLSQANEQADTVKQLVQ